MEKSKLELLCEEIGCDERLGKSLLIFTGGDIDAAKKILNSIEKNIAVIKAKFILQNLKLYGAFMLFFNTSLNKVEKVFALFSDNKEVMKLEPVKGVMEYQSDLNSLRRYTDKIEFADRFVANCLLDKIKDKLTKLFRERTIDESQTIQLFSEIVDEVTTETNTLLKFNYEYIDVFQLGKACTTESTEHVPQNDLEKRNDSSSDKELSFFVLECEPIYSPIKGKDVGLINPGDYLRVRIADDRDIGKYLAQLLNALDQNGQPAPIAAKIISKDSVYENLLRIVVEFGPGIHGKVICGTDVKIDSEFAQENLIALRDKHAKKNKLRTPRVVTAGMLIAMIIVMVVILIIMILLT